MLADCLYMYMILNGLKKRPPDVHSEFKHVSFTAKRSAYKFSAASAELNRVKF